MTGLPPWWQSDKPYIIGDCVAGMSKIPDESIDMLLTDPPYGIDFLSNRTDNHVKIASDDHATWLDALPVWLPEFKRILKPTGVCACCCAGGGKLPVVAEFTFEFIKHFNLIQTVVWDKGTIGLGWRYRPAYETVIVGSKDPDKYNWYGGKDVSNIFRFRNIIPQAGDHPTPKPHELFEEFIELHTKPGDIVFDPFLGSGTTLLAARRTGRIGLGFELDSRYEELIISRGMVKIEEGWF